MFNFKKIASVASSALMIGSTVALAAAANYPAPFVQNGDADVAIVTGQSAASTDTTAAIALSNDLSAAFTSQGGSSNTPVGAPTGGDSVLLAKSSDKVNLGNVVSSVFGSSVSDDDLPELLADGTYSNDNNDDFDYEQRITLGSGLIFNYFSDSDYQDRMPTLGFNQTSSQMMLNYTLDFTDDVESDVSGGDLIDLETTDLMLLGKSYYVSDASNDTNIQLTLLDTANTAIAREGETSTVTVGDTTYDVSITFIDPDRVKFSVGGEQTPLLEEGETYQIADNVFLGVKEILARDIAGALGQVEFSIGSGKLELTSGQSIKLNDDSIQAVTAEIKRGSAGSSGIQTIDRINLVWTLDNDAFIAPETELVMPGFEALKFTLADVSVGDAEETSVEAGASDYIRLVTTIKDGSIELPILYASSGNFAGIGKSSSELLVTSSNAASVGIIYNYTRGDRMFIASWNTSSEAESYVLKFDSFSNDNGINKTVLYKKEDNSWVEVKDGLKAGDTATLGSLTLTVQSISPYNDRTVNVTGNDGTSWNTLYTNDGLKVFLPYIGTNSSGAPGVINFTYTGTNFTVGHSTDSFHVTFVEENKDEDIAAGGQFNVTVDDNSNDEVEANAITTGRSTITDPDDSNHITSHVYSDLGTFVERTGASSDQRVVTINYYGEQLSADLYLAQASATSSGGSTGALGNIVVTDNQVSSVSSKNMIVLGGSCINTVAAQLIGASSPACGADFTGRTQVGSGQFLIQSFNSPWSTGKVALLVAGYDAADTQNAATYLRTQTTDTTAGKKYVGSTATSATLVTEDRKSVV